MSTRLVESLLGNPGRACLRDVIASVHTGPRPPSGSQSAARGESLAERVLAILTSSRHRKGSLKRMAFARCRRSLLSTLGRRIRGALPIQLTLMAFPFKVPNPAKVGRRDLPDLAELAALQRIGRLAAEIRAAYPPGLELHLLHDGSYIADIFGVPADSVRRYEIYLARLIRLSGLDALIRTHDFVALLSRSNPDLDGAIPRLIDGTLAWWRRTRGKEEWVRAFRKTLGMLDLRRCSPATAARLLACGRAGALPPRCAALEARVHRAMMRYHLRDALLHRFDPRPVFFPDAIHATTRVQPGRLALWLVRRGRGELPWHGVGVIDRRAQISVASFASLHRPSAVRPIHVEGETTPFGYLRIAPD